jgi:hypothetical protein
MLNCILYDISNELLRVSGNNPTANRPKTTKTVVRQQFEDNMCVLEIFRKSVLKSRRQ